MPIEITNANASALSGHQVKILVNIQSIIAAGRMNSDGSDIRMSIDCCSPLCFWVETGINTDSTYIWVRTDLTASAADTIYMYYGNSGATDGSDAKCTFDLYEDFSSTQASFAAACGSITESYTASDLQLTWGSNGMLVSDTTFPLSSTYTVESDVTSATGTWPGLYWARDSDKKSYGLMINSTQARISVMGGGTDYCSGHNWASSLIPYTSAAGLWSFTWTGTGMFDNTFPTIGNIPCTDALYAKDSDLRLMVGGISSGSGSIDMNWIRVRKYAAITPTFVLGPEAPITGAQVVSITVSAMNLCSGDSLQLDAGAGFLNYSWSSGGSTQSINVNTAGTYTVIALDPAGCLSTDSVMIDEFTPIPIDLGIDIIVCPDSVSSVVLDAGNNHTAYLWNSGGSGSTETVINVGIYDVVVTDSNGCMAYDTITISAYVGPTADFTSTIIGLGATFANASTNGVTYSWDFGDGNTSTLQDPSHTYTADGNYTICLTVTGPDGCIDDTCILINITTVGLNSYNPLSLNIYPIPASDILNIESSAIVNDGFELYTIDGKLSISGGLHKGLNEIDVQHLTRGVYIIRLTNYPSFNRRIVIK